MKNGEDVLGRIFRRCLLLSKQYTFKSTRKTEWIEALLDAMGKGEKSDYIRECFILGHQHMIGINKTPKPETPIYKPKNISEYIPIVAENIDEPDMEITGEVECNMVDLESKLNSMYDD